ncbi:hypothetical protein FRC02_004486 [Tulasnella sp. 418]|nr:hypothetical protein FRC02_004486 [Tulasnella sp. 418]
MGLSSAVLWSVVPFAVFYAVQVIRGQREGRTDVIPKHKERVVILGASSGIGRAIAHQYASREAAVVIVGRRETMLEEVRAECDALGAPIALQIVADFTVPEDLVRVRNVVERELGGLDTLIISAGVSALQPLVTGVAQAVKIKGEYAIGEPTLGGIQRAKEIASKAVASNYIGPLISAATFIPMLELTSHWPAVVLISSVASVIPAPTRSIYASTKSASLILFQSLSIEHPLVQFSHVLPATVEGDFRAGAVDGGGVREDLKGALDRNTVAKECLKAVDNGTKVVWLPKMMRIGHLLYWLMPSIVEGVAAKKYNFTP